jgi:diaminohydroxyphosphoribosylaminopyrimidine deaminase/5-amino-6-(5-phosphoribosylamino)uracil reductase
MNDKEYMQKALKLAEKGYGWVNPNPMVGALIVKNNIIIGTGYHHRYGTIHAERDAIEHCTDSLNGATLYVTLEPCCHWGKTPPCTDVIISSGVQRVVIGSEDPNPLVAGAGIEILRRHGIEVVVGVLKEDCIKLNEVFFHYIQNKTPYVVMKYAMTLDGKIATQSGKSKWITGETARERVHKDRHRYSGILVGIGTIMADNPLLTCRLPDAKNPVRIICDTELKMSLQANVVQTANVYKTIIATCCTDSIKIQTYKDAGCKMLYLPKKEGHVDLVALMAALGKEGIDSILLEGGETLNWAALKNGIVNKIQAYIAPKIFGGVNAKAPVGGNGIEDPNGAYRLSSPMITKLGDDILMESEVIGCLPE